MDWAEVLITVAAGLAVSPLYAAVKSAVRAAKDRQDRVARLKALEAELSAQALRLGLDMELTRDELEAISLHMRDLKASDSEFYSALRGRGPGDDCAATSDRQTDG